ncbi:MAG: membrane protein insertion efficiency factor YidD [Wenzhouxiangella sp.]|jgi:putative membrane protein insertion efficiency factor|nr:membrane protein insertion efficiency factor YidD [Wenzhouxiangella sp.]
MTRFLLALIRCYRYLLSPWLGGHCRFTPTCSVYAMQAIELYGPARGSWMACKRLLRCHPLCAGGHDPVPGHEDQNRGTAVEAGHDDSPSSGRAEP